jgi:hypothetical protein
LLNLIALPDRDTCLRWAGLVASKTKRVFCCPIGNEGRSVKQLKALLKSEIAGLNKAHYDTKENELICDLFHELASIVHVDFKDNLNSWLYGPVLTTLIKMQKVLHPQKNCGNISATLYRVWHRIGNLYS